jgi:hypothetical protein
MTGRAVCRRWTLSIAGTLVAALIPVQAISAEPTLDLAIPKGVQVNSFLQLGDVKPTQVSPRTAFDVDPDGLPVVAEGSSLELLGSSRNLVALGNFNIDDFAWMRDGRLLLVTQGHLAALSPKGVVLGTALPSAGMRIRPAGEDTAYVFGGPSEPQNHDVYLFKRDRTVAKLANLPVAVTAVAGNESTTYVAADKMILRITLNQPAVVVLQAQDPVISLETTPQDGLFYSTQSTVGYIDRDGGATEFLKGDGGLLRVRESQLFVLLLSGNLLRISPTDGFGAALGSAGKPRH